MSGPQMREAVIGLIDGGGNLIGAFDRMAFAEEEIDAAKRRHPERSKEIHSSFGMLCPPGPMPEMAYRSHAREILDAVGAGQEPPKVTWSMICLAFSEASQRAPLAREFSLAYIEAFRRGFPGSLKGPEGEALDTVPSPDCWETVRIEEILTEVRRRLGSKEVSRG